MEQLSIIGSGTMGHSIALGAAWAGIPVKMYGLTQDDLENGLKSASEKLEVLRENDLVNTFEAHKIIQNISASTDLDVVISGASFIIETIPENLKLKNDLFRYLDTQCGSDVILASNTSGLSLTKITEGMVYPGRALITHFWNPAHLIPLVEVVKTPGASVEIFQRAMDLLKVMGKKPVEIKKEVPGLLGNRLQFALFREAQYLLEEGIASKEDIDAAVTYSIGRRLSVTGPLMSADMGGLDVFSNISDYLFKDLSVNDQSFQVLKQLVSKGKFGAKTGEGYYTWSNEFSQLMNHDREVELIRLLKEDRIKE